MTPGRLLKKIFSLTLSAFAVLIASGFLSLQPIVEQSAYAQQAGSGCENITMATGKAETAPVLVEGVPNSGTMNFDDPQFDASSRTCVGQSKNASGAYELSGWAWNTNLGWMSFNCGADGDNNGFSCGATQYGTILDTATGKIRGYAWGDNIGWIEMGCDSGKNGTTDCGSINYGVQVATANGTNGGTCGTSLKKGDLYGYAWTDTVGWMNFCGAHVDLDALETLSEQISPIGGGTTPPGGGTTPSGEEFVIDEENQVADIQGNVSISVVDTSGLTVKTKIGQSLGEQAQSRRESFYRAVKSSVTATPTGVNSGGERLAEFGGGILNYKSSVLDSNHKKTSCVIILDDLLGSQIDIAQNRDTTIVAKGCNIFIDSNILSGDKGGRLGIIALSDLTIPGDQKGGNIYVCGRVTDIEANLVADGALMSYGNATDPALPCEKSLDSTTGYPIFGYKDWAEAISNIATIREFLHNQLTIWGSLVSNNTYGSSVSTDENATEFVLGDGSKGTQEEARLFDLNYLRYAKTKPKEGATSGELCWTDDVTLSKKFGDTCEVNNPDTQSIVNIIYRAPTGKMPVFN